MNLGTATVNNQELDTAEMVMLVAGTLLFVILAVGLIVLLAKEF